MKSKFLFAALLLILSYGAAEAQHSRNDNNRDRGQASNNTRYRDNDAVTHGPRDSRYAYDRYRTPMTAKAFRQAIDAVRDASFDSDRLAMAKVVLRHQYMSTEQIRSMAKLFRFDSSRLAFAKYAYSVCADPEHYYLVANVFTFSSSKEELYRYLARV